MEVRELVNNMFTWINRSTVKGKELRNAFHCFSVMLYYQDLKKKHVIFDKCGGMDLLQITKYNNNIRFLFDRSNSKESSHFGFIGQVELGITSIGLEIFFPKGSEYSTRYLKISIYFDDIYVWIINFDLDKMQTVAKIVRELVKEEEKEYLQLI
jgi:hypothetical protein